MTKLYKLASQSGLTQEELRDYLQKQVIERRAAEAKAKNESVRQINKALKEKQDARFKRVTRRG